jgi:signal transduction histidine kinase
MVSILMIHTPKIHFALLTSESGDILKILRDDNSFVSDDKKQISHLFDDQEKMKLFYREILYHGAAVNWEMKLKESPEPLRMYGGKIGDNIVVLCATEKVNMLEYINELVGINSVQTNTIRNQSKMIKKNGSSGDAYLNKLSELNNSLVNLQRTLVKKNEALKRLTYQMDTVFKSAGLGFVFLKPDGKIDMYNDAGQDFLVRITGQQFKTGMSVQDFIPALKDDCAENILCRAIHGDRLSEDIYINGWFEVRTSPVLDEEGNREGVLLISEKIDRRKHYEKTIESQKEFLYLMNKILRHDLANVFTITKSATSLYKRTSDKTMLDSITEAADRGIKIIDRMKNTEKILYDPDKLRRIRLEQAIRSVMKDFKEMEYSCEGEGTIYGDEFMYSLLHNLVSNARRHGKATKMAFIISQEDHTVVLKVANNGKAIPEEIRHKVFDENFKYGKAAHTGLGLYIVQKATERYGGNVKIDTCGEWPTCFIFTFPAKDQNEKNIQ